MKLPRFSADVRISLLYLFWGAVWVLFSDSLLAFIIHDPQTITRIQTYKGWFFVAASALLIYYFLHQYLLAQQRAHDAILESEKALNKAQRIARMGSWVWHIPENRLEWSDEMYRIFGLDRQEFTGDVQQVIIQAVHPDDRASLIRLLTGADDPTAAFPAEHRILGQDGSLRYLRVEAGEKVMDKSGRPLTISGIVQDITEHKKAEKRLRDSEERLRLALMAANQGIYDYDILTKETITNDSYARMLGYDPDHFVETNDLWFERMHPDDRSRVEKTFEDYIHARIPEYRIEYRQRAANGDWKWIQSIGSIVEYDPQGRPLRMLGTHTDITESKNSALEIARLLEESQRRLQRIGALRKIDAAISSSLELKPTLEVLIAQVRNELKVDAVAILLFDEKRNEFRYAASVGFHSRRIENARVPFGLSLAGRAAQSGAMIEIHRLNEDIDPAFASLLADDGIQDYCGIPLAAKEKLVGVLELFHRSPLHPEREWLEYYETLAGQAAVAIENAQLLESLQRANDSLTHAYDATIEGWSKALDLRDKETEGHTLRVTEMTLELARKMNLSDEALVHIRRGTLLHDIGKMGIPDAILLKEGLLTDEERRIIQLHPQFAYDMLKAIDYLLPALEIPHLHHEKWDGTGYPLGLKGEQIPLAARLFAIVDVYDALTSDRPYRKAWTRQAALDYIKEQSGRHFDPQIVEIFIQTLPEN